MKKKRVPSEELQRRWLEGVLLPGFQDPRESCLAELSEYSGLPREEVEARCTASQEDLKRLWEQRARDSAREVSDFYRAAEPYVYGLLWWHALQKGPAVAWNARIVELALEHGVRTALEFGGGIGSTALLLQRAGIETTLADISEPCLAFARWRATRRGLKLRVVDLERDPLEGARFDLVTAIDVLEHVPDPIATLERLASHVRTGGYLCFDLIATEFDPDEPFHLMRSKYPVRARIRALGFQPETSFGKYLFLRKVERGRVAQRLLAAWDVLRWRLYYLAQGRWPRAR